MPSHSCVPTHVLTAYAALLNLGKHAVNHNLLLLILLLPSLLLLLLLRQILRAMTDGVDVRGLYYWTLLDNFEW